MSDDALANSLAERVMGWRLSRDRFIKTRTITIAILRAVRIDEALRIEWRLPQ
jgi:hypothetical protein